MSKTKGNKTYNPMHDQTYVDMFENQNKTLDKIDVLVDEFGNKTKRINEEIVLQGKNLDSLTLDIESADEKVKRVTKKTKIELKYTQMCNDMGLLPCIIFLVIIIIIAIFLIIYA